MKRKEPPRSPSPESSSSSEGNSWKNTATATSDDQNQSPMTNHVVLCQILRLLPVSVLKVVRLVCRQWNEYATPQMLREGVIVLDAENLEELSAIESWMDSNPYVLHNHVKYDTNYSLRPNFHNLSCDRITHQTYPNIWKLLGPHVKSLVLSQWWQNKNDLTLQDYEDLLLHKCPKLERLALPSTSQFKSAASFLLCSTVEGNNVRLNLRTLEITGRARPDMRFFRIFSIAPLLTSLKTECSLIREFWNPFPSYSKEFDERMSALKSLDCRKYSNDSMSGLTAMYFQGRSWNLETLIFECYELSEHHIRRSLEHIRHTLKVLRIIWFNKKYDLWPMDQGKPWVISNKLINLEKFEITCDSLCEGPIFCRTLVYCTLLPRLKNVRLTLHDSENEQEDNNHINLCEWDEGLFSTMYKDSLSFLKREVETQEEVPLVLTDESSACQLLETALTQEDDSEDEIDIETESESEPETESGSEVEVEQADQNQQSTSSDNNNSSSSNSDKSGGIVRECLESLCFPPKMCDVSVIDLAVKIFPNIRELKMGVPTVEFLQGILAQWTSLERLELTLSAEIDWNLILVGRTNRPSAKIANLKQLKHLRIVIVPPRKHLEEETELAEVENPGYSHQNGLAVVCHILNDLFIYEGLIKLNVLQFVSVTGQNFSVNAVEILRDNLLPFCHLDFKN